MNFGYETTSTETLAADWIIDGPTNWDGSTLASGVTGHTTGAAPSMTFCKADLASRRDALKVSRAHYADVA